MKQRGLIGLRPPFASLALALFCVLCWAIAMYYPVGGQVSVGSHPAVRPYVFPSGGRVIFPGYRLVALYGVPNQPVLGALGGQPLDATVARVKELAGTYQTLTSEHVMPTLEIIATVASSSPGEDGSYSYAIDSKTLLTWALAAKQSGVYVVLDLQPGRSDFLSQAIQLQPILTLPNVGLALDPEWRLGPQQLPLKQIGSVGIDEVNNTAAWLATLTRVHHLPQKLFLLHEFTLTMLPNRDDLDVSHPELAYALQMDGQGGQNVKLDTWGAIKLGAPAQLHLGWKNFYAKDTPLRSPEQTMALMPQPWYVSYQ